MQGKLNKVILIILDSLGVGATPDAGMYGDTGSNTLSHVAEVCNGLKIPNMQKLGIGNITYVKGADRNHDPIGFYGKMRERSAGKDTCVGHWEIAGLDVDIAFETYPAGFPEDMVQKLSKMANTEFIGNIVASGTEIIMKLGLEHFDTKKPILYTSADSVLQIAAHEDVIAVERLYEICEFAREISNEYRIARVIARPYKGKHGEYVRTAYRKDYTVDPPAATVLDACKDSDIPVYGIGKTASIFNYKGIFESIHTENNHDGMQKTLELTRNAVVDSQDRCFIFTNLVDFDSLYGHRRNPEGYGKALEEFDEFLPNIMRAMGDHDLLILTADHGNDPTFPGTDHTREHIPLLVYNRNLRPGTKAELGVRKTFSDIAETIADGFNLETRYGAESFWSDIQNHG